MDKQLRELERLAATGDPEAEAKLAVYRDRLRVKHPFLFHFNGGRIARRDRHHLNWDANDQCSYHWLFTSSLVRDERYRLGHVLPRSGILESITVQVDQAVIQEYQIGIMQESTTKIFGSARLKVGDSVACMPKLGEGEIIIPKLTPFGVRVRSNGQQGSTFNAIHVMLEIWM